VDVPENHIGGLAADAGQRDEILHPVGHLAAEALDDRARRQLQRFRLLSKESGRHDELLDLLARRHGHRERIGDLAE
jgi:hypothetical protein